MRRSVLLLLAPLLLAADPAREDAIKKEREKLQGTWVSADQPVSPGPPLLLVFTFTGDKVKTASYYPDLNTGQLEQSAAEATVTLEPTKEPKAIDLTMTSGPLKGKIARGIYQFGPDGLKLRLEETRPADFSPHALVLKRSTPEEVKKSVAGMEKVLAEKKAEIEARKMALPVSRMARPIDRAATDVLSLDLNRGGRVEVPGRDQPLEVPVELQGYLKEQYQQRKAKVGAENVRTVIVLRAHRDADAGSLRRMAHLCAGQGFPTIFLRVMRAPSEEGQLELVVPHWRRPESFADLSVRVEHDARDNRRFSEFSIPSGKGIDRKLPSLAALERFLEEARKGPANPESITVRPGDWLGIGALVEIYDVCLKAGFATIVLGNFVDFDLDPKPLFRVGVPDNDSLARAEKEIRAIYQPLYARPAAADLARRLRKAASVCEDAAAEYVLLREVAEAADRAGDPLASVEVLGRLEECFDTDVGPEKLAKLIKAPPSATVVELAVHEAGQVILRGQRELGARYFQFAQRTAKQLNNAQRIAFVEERRKVLGLPPLGKDEPSLLPVKPAVTPAASSTAAVGREKGGEEQHEPRDAVAGGLLWIVVPAGAVILIAGGGLAWWLVRGDRAVRNRLAEARKVEFTLPSTEESQEPPPQPPAPCPPT